MPRPATYKTNELLELIAPVFRFHGFADASMTALSKASNLSKASLYHHFPDGKPEMARKILGIEGQRMQAHILAPLSSNNPAGALVESMDGVLEFYRGNVPTCMMNSLLLGGGAELFRSDIQAAVGAWKKSLQVAYTSLTGDAEEGRAWSVYAIERIQGALILCKVEASRAPLEQAVAELKGDIETIG